MAAAEHHQDQTRTSQALSLELTDASREGGSQAELVLAGTWLQG